MSPAPFPPPDRVGSIVLVHGAWVGEWSWSPILPILRRSGRAVHAVSLRGHGVRSGESGPHIRLADHVDDVVAVVETFDLDAITLVGHSYGGRVISRAYARISDRVERLVYLDAHAPLGDAATRATADGADIHDEMVPFGRFLPEPAEFGGADAVEWFMSRVRPHSAATLADAFTVELPDDVDTTYVAATGNPGSPFAGYAAAARSHPNWRYHELPGSHWLMVARPGDVASIILDPAGWPGDPGAYDMTGNPT